MASFEAARGYKSKVKVMFENAYRTRPDNPEAVLIRFWIAIWMAGAVWLLTNPCAVSLHPASLHWET